MKLVTSLIVFAVFFAVGLAANARPVKPSTPPPAPAPTPSAVSYGAETTQEIQVGAVGAGSLLSEKAAGSSITLIEARGSYSRVYYRENAQLGGEVHFVSSSGGAKSTSYVEAAVFGNWNFDTVLDRALYAKAGLGTFSIVNDKGDNENKFGFLAGLGKRIPIWTHVNYNPEARLYKKGDLDPSFEIAFLNLSLMW